MKRPCLVLVCVLMGIVGCRSDADRAPSSEAPVVSTQHRVPERIVSLVPSTTEMLFALGVGNRVVGRTMHCNVPDEVETLPSIGSGLDPDLEALLALAPDLVVGTGMQSALPAVERLRTLGIAVEILPDDTLADVPRSFERLAAAVGAPERAAPIVEAFAAEMAHWRGMRWEVRPRTFLPVSDDPIYAAGPESRLGEIVALTGGANVLTTGSWVHVDAETLVGLVPDVIIASERHANAAAWAGLGNTTPPRVCVVDADRIARPGPRMIDAIREIGTCIHR